jgi:flagellum-specific peptidoglycan hydrolase FlgJ
MLIASQYESSPHTVPFNFIDILFSIKGKYKGKGYSIKGQEGPEGE